MLISNRKKHAHAFSTQPGRLEPETPPCDLDVRAKQTQLVHKEPQTVSTQPFSTANEIPKKEDGGESGFQFEVPWTGN
jgi:hypothetical protein